MVFKKIFSARNSNSFNTLFIDDQSPIRKGRQLWGNFRRRFRSEAAAKNSTFFLLVTFSNGMAADTVYQEVETVTFTKK